MWQEALRVAIVGFSVVFGSLGVLALSVYLMGVIFKMGKKKPEGV